MRRYFRDKARAGPPQLLNPGASHTHPMDRHQNQSVATVRPRTLDKFSDLAGVIEQALSAGGPTIVTGISEFDHKDRALFGLLSAKYPGLLVCYCGDPPRKI